MVITYPPIKFPCYAGIDFPSQEELATFSDGKEMNQEANLLKWFAKVLVLTFWDTMMLKILQHAVGIPKDSMCFTCSSGDYESLGITPEFRSQR